MPMKIPAGFRPEYLDFQRGIRVGNLEENERITRVLKLALESRYSQPFVTERLLAMDRLPYEGEPGREAGLFPHQLRLREVLPHDEYRRQALRVRHAG